MEVINKLMGKMPKSAHSFCVFLNGFGGGGDIFVLYCFVLRQGLA